MAENNLILGVTFGVDTSSLDSQVKGAITKAQKAVSAQKLQLTFNADQTKITKALQDLASRYDVLKKSISDTETSLAKLNSQKNVNASKSQKLTEDLKGYKSEAAGVKELFNQLKRLSTEFDKLISQRQKEKEATEAAEISNKKLTDELSAQKKAQDSVVKAAKEMSKSGDYSALLEKSNGQLKSMKKTITETMTPLDAQSQKYMQLNDLLKQITAQEKLRTKYGTSNAQTIKTEQAISSGNYASLLQTKDIKQLQEYNKLSQDLMTIHQKDSVELQNHLKFQSQVRDILKQSLTLQQTPITRSTVSQMEVNTLQQRNEKIAAYNKLIAQTDDTTRFGAMRVQVLKQERDAIVKVNQVSEQTYSNIRKQQEAEAKKMATQREMQRILNQEPDTRAKINQQVSVLQKQLDHIKIGSTEYLKTQKQIAELQAKMPENVRKTNSALSEQSRQTSQLKDLAAQYVGIYAASNVFRNIINVTKNLELQKVALNALTGSLIKTEEIWNKLEAQSVKSPFKLTELIQYTKQLAAYRVETDELFDTTKRLGDISAGLGTSMDRIILAFGQVKAATVLRGCLGYGTEIQLFNGDIKEVQNIVVGDELINENGDKVNVLELIFGHDPMYKVQQTSGSERRSYRVNKDHILTLWNVPNQELVDIYVEDYIKDTESYLGVKKTDEGFEYYNISVASDGNDYYYGFVLDGNKRFLLGDGTITHNTELRQFTETGLDLLPRLAEKFTDLYGRVVEVGEVFDLISDRAVSFEMVNEIFKEMTSAGGVFFNMQELQANTLAGSITNLKDQLALFYNELGQSSAGVTKWIYDLGKSTLAVLTNSEGLRSTLGGLIVTYGAYRVGLALTTKSIKAAKVATVEKNLAAKVEYLTTKNAGKANLIYNTSLTGVTNSKLKDALATSALTKSQVAYITTTNAANKANNIFVKSFYKLKAAILANPILATVAVLAGLASALYSIQSASDRATEKMMKLNAEFNKLREERYLSIQVIFDDKQNLDKRLNEFLIYKKKIEKLGIDVPINVDITQAEKAVDQIREYIATAEILADFQKGVKLEVAEGTGWFEFGYDTQAADLTQQFTLVQGEIVKTSNTLKAYSDAVNELARQGKLSSSQAEANKELQKQVDILTQMEATFDGTLESSRLLNEQIAKVNNVLKRTGGDYIGMTTPDAWGDYIKQLENSTEDIFDILEANSYRLKKEGKYLMGDALNEAILTAIREVNPAIDGAMLEDVITTINNQWKKEVSSRNLGLDTEFQAKVVVRKDDNQILKEWQLLFNEIVKQKAVAQAQQELVGKVVIVPEVSLSSDGKRSSFAPYSQFMDTMQEDEIPVTIAPMVNQEDVDKAVNYIKKQLTKEDVALLFETDLEGDDLQRKKDLMAGMTAEEKAQLQLIKSGTNELAFRNTEQDKAVGYLTKESEMLGNIYDLREKIDYAKGLKETEERNRLIAEYTKNLQIAEQSYVEQFGDVPSQDKTSGGGGSQEDPYILLYRNRIKFMEDFQGGVEDLNKYLNRSNALMQEQAIMAQRGFSVGISTSELEGSAQELSTYYDKVISVIRSKLAELGGSEFSQMSVEAILSTNVQDRTIKAWQKFLQETFNSKTDFDTNQLEEQLKKELAELTEKIKVSKEAKNFFDGILSQTGDIDLATNLSVKLYGDNGGNIGDSIRKQIKTLFGGDGISKELQEGIDKAVSGTYVDYNKLIELSKGIDATETQAAIQKFITQGITEESKNISEMVKNLSKYKTIEDRRNEILRAGAAERAEIRKRGLEDEDEWIALSEQQESTQLSDLAYEAFKGSDLYLQVFDDLNFATTTSLNLMKEKFDEMRSLWSEDLSPENIKELKSKLDELSDELISRNPFESLADSIKTYREEIAKASMEQREASLFEAVQVESSAQSRFNTDSQALVENEFALKEEMDKAEAERDLEKIERLQVEGELLAANLSVSKKLLSSAKVTTAEARAAVSQIETLIANLVEATSEAEKKIDEVKSTVLEFGSVIESGMEVGLFGDIGEETSALTKDILDNADEIYDASKVIIKGILTLVTGVNAGMQSSSEAAATSIRTVETASVILAIISAAIQLATAIVDVFVGAKNRELQRAIDSQKDKVAELEYAYSRLGKTIEESFGAASVAAMKAQEALQKQQIAAYEAMISAENQKKASERDDDQIKEWQNEIRDLEDAISDAQGAYLELFTGTSATSAIKSWVDSYLDEWARLDSTSASRMQSMKDNFREMIMEMVANNYLASKAQDIFDGIFDAYDEKIKQQGKLSDKDMLELQDALYGGLEAFEQYADPLLQTLQDAGLNLKEFEDDELSGLYKGIATASEETVTTLAGYWSSTLQQMIIIRGILEDWAKKGYGDSIQGSNGEIIDIAYIKNIEANTKSMLAELVAQNEMLGRVITLGRAGNYVVKTEIVA